MSDAPQPALAGAATAASPPVPDVLYHYTTRPGVMGITERRTLFASSIGHLNDATEFRYAHSVLKAALATAARGLPAKRELMIEWMLNNLEFSGRRVVPGLPGPTNSLYVAAFCTDGDRLSQWRAYGRDGGYALGFRRSALQAVANEQGFALTQCTYDEADHLRQANDFAAAVVRDVAGLPDQLPDEQVPAPVRILSRMLDAIQTVAPTWKKLAFYEEKEWRLVSTGQANQQVKFRLSPAAIVPYIEIKLDNPSTTADGKVTAIERVVVGPSHDAFLSMGSLTRLLEVRGFLVGQMQTSAVPYRPA